MTQTVAGSEYDGSRSDLKKKKKKVKCGEAVALLLLERAVCCRPTGFASFSASSRATSSRGTYYVQCH